MCVLLLNAFLASARRDVNGRARGPAGAAPWQRRGTARRRKSQHLVMQSCQFARAKCYIEVLYADVVTCHGPCADAMLAVHVEKNSYLYDKNASQLVNRAPQTVPPTLSQQNDKTQHIQYLSLKAVTTISTVTARNIWRYGA
eukprot:6192531-Pleurochrysis_carterae.AAC.1